MSTQNLPNNEIKPLRWMGSFLLFGIPALINVAMYYWLIPWLEASGIRPQYAYTGAHLALFLGLIAAAIIGYWRETTRHTWKTFLSRMRIQRMTGTDWNWMTGAIFAFAILYFGGLMLTDKVLASIGWTHPAFGLRPEGLSDWILFFGLLVFNILGEELWWRGYILPRQELAFGDKTWILHGILWAFFHLYKWWEVPAMILPAMVIPFMAQRRQNTTPGLVMHYLLNGFNALLILA
jgi:membrane protease YdiL (CAAX protease family)